MRDLNQLDWKRNSLNLQIKPRRVRVYIHISPFCIIM